MEYNRPKLYVFNFSAQFIANLLSQLIGLITIPYIAKTLGAEKYGEFSLLLTIMAYVSIIYTFGIPSFAGKEIARSENFQKIVNPTFTLQFILAAFSLLIITLIGVITFNSFEHIAIYFIAGISFLFAAANFTGIFIAREQLWKASYLALVGRVVFAIFLFLFVHNSKDLLIFTIVYIIGYYVIPSLLSIILYTKQFGKITLTLKYDKWKQCISESSSIGFSMFTGRINQYAAQLFIGIFLSTADLGTYSVGYRFIGIVTTIHILVNMVVTPTISRLYASGNRESLFKFLRSYFGITILMGIIPALIIGLSSDFLVKTFLSKEYANSAIFLKVWAYGLLPFTALSLFFAGTLIYMDGSKDYLIVSIVGTAITVITLPILLKTAGIFGIPYNPVIAEITVTCGGLYFFRKRLKVSWIELFQVLNPLLLIGDIKFIFKKKMP